MNKIEILNALAENILEYNILGSIEILNVTTNLELAASHDAVFYNIRDDGKACQLFLSRLALVSPALVILSGSISQSLKETLSATDYIIVPPKQFMLAQKRMCDYLYPRSWDESNGPLCVGITGTNGKTSTAQLAAQISWHNNISACSIGTLGLVSAEGEKICDLGSTTPSYIELRRLIFQYQARFCVFFIEVSSHALVQDRLYDIKLAAAAWTSFSQDHLDYHKNLTEYFLAKSLIGQKLKGLKQKIIVAQSLLPQLSNFNLSPLRYKVAPELDFSSISLPFFKAAYNRENMQLAFALNVELWGHSVRPKIAKMQPPAGRFDIMPYKDGLVVIDYAHTPDALENICRTLVTDFVDYNLKVVFGCGGNRDKVKRPLMGAIASRYGKVIILTSDNPRDEAPHLILDDIKAGIVENNSFELVLEVDREKAIRLALKDFTNKDLVLIAGKGHEDYQIIAGKKTYFSDHNICKKIFAEESIE